LSTPPLLFLVRSIYQFEVTLLAGIQARSAIKQRWFKRDVSGFEPTLAPDRGRLSSQRSGNKGLQGVAKLDGENFDKMLEVDPETGAQAFKEAAA
jgi:hypothetical protein